MERLTVTSGIGRASDRGDADSERGPRAALARFAYRSPRTPARLLRLLRAPPLTDAVAGKVVLVTGASSGIGRATAIRVGAAGATVLLLARTAEALQEVREAIKCSGGVAHVYPCDLRDPEAIESVVAEILERHGRVDVLVNNAGRSIRRPIDRSYDRLHDYERTMRLNYFAPLQLILALLPGMRERRSGHVINVSTMGVFVQGSRFSAYIASKAALDTFSNCLAVEARADGIRVTSVHPALIRTPMVAPTEAYDGAPALTAEEAAETIAEAIRTGPPRLVPRLGRMFALARLIAPRVVEARLSSKYRSSLELTAHAHADEITARHERSTR